MTTPQAPEMESVLQRAAAAAARIQSSLVEILALGPFFFPTTYTLPAHVRRLDAVASVPEGRYQKNTT